MGYNEELFSSVLATYSQYAHNSSDKNIRRKQKRLIKTYSEIVDQNDWKKYGFRAALHELKTHELLERFYPVISCNDNKPGPDFIQNGAIFECVSVTFGEEGSDIYKRLTREKTGVFTDTLPRKDIIFRVSTAIDNKRNQYYKHIENRAICPSNPYIIVIDMSLIYSEHSQLFSNFHEMLLPTMGIGEPYIKIDKATFQTVDSDFIRHDRLQKSNNAEINMALFLREEYKFLSGILFTSASLPEKYDSTNVIFMDNPRAQIKLHYGIYKGIKAWLYDFETELYSVREI